MNKSSLYEIGEIALDTKSSAYNAAGKIWSMTGQLSFGSEAAARAAVVTAEIGCYLLSGDMTGKVRVYVRESENGEELLLKFVASRKFAWRVFRSIHQLCNHLGIQHSKRDDNTIETVVSISNSSEAIEPQRIRAAQNKAKRQSLMETLYTALLEKHIQARRNLAEIREREKELVASRDRLRRMSSQLALTEENEKKRLATALHDSVLQSLSATALKARVLEDMITDSEAKSLLSSIRKELSEELQDLRSLTFELCPPILYELGLSAAVEWLGDQIKKDGIEFVFETREDPHGSGQPLQVMAFQCVREMLANIRKHSRAQRVTVNQRVHEQKLMVAVKDDGTGFDPASLAHVSKERSSFGLMNIMERLREAGGDLKIESAPGHGTLVEFVIPLDHDPNVVVFHGADRIAAQA